MASSTNKKSAGANDVKIDVDHVDFARTYRPHQKAFEVHDKSDEWDYRWVRDTPDRLDSVTRMGFTLVTGDEVTTARAADPDGKLRAGGKHVLVKRPREIAEKHRDYLRQRAHNQLSAPRESFKNKASRASVKTYDTSQSVVGSPRDSLPDVDND